MALFYVAANVEAQKRQRPSLPDTDLSEKQKARKEFIQQEWEAYMALKSASETLQTDENIDVTFYHLTIDVNTTAQSISGNTYIELKSTVNNLTQVKLNLHTSMTVTAVGENAISWSRSGSNVLNLNLDQSYNIGETVNLRIYYNGTPIIPAGTGKGFRFLTHSSTVPAVTALSTPYLAHYWFPCKDGPYDKADSVKVDIIVPDVSYQGYPLMGVSNGMLYDTIIDGGKRTYRWKHNYPIVPYYVSVSVSNYRVFGEQYNRNGHDFPLTYYVFPNDYNTALSTFSGVPDVFDAFIHYFGDYPFKTEKYGMTQIASGLTYIEKQTNSIMASVAPSAWWLVVHELAHMWFGNSITNRPWNHVWLNEGFATYAEALHEEYYFGKAAYHQYMNNTLTSGWDYTRTLYLSDDSNPTQIFHFFYYDKGAWVLHMLRNHLGDDLFFEILKSYAQDPEFKYLYVNTETFREYIESKSGMDLEVFFDQWVYGTSFPDISFNYSYDPSTGKNGVTISQIQSWWTYDRYIYEMYLPLRFTLSDGSVVEEKVFNNQRIQSFHFDHGLSVTNMQLDPDQWNMIWWSGRNTSLAVPPAPMITSFNIPGQVNNTVINELTRTILITMPAETSLTTLSPAIGLTANTTVSPTSGVPNDFSSPVKYTVTGINHSQRIYTVYVSTVPSDEKLITSFTIPNYISSEIDHDEETILVIMPPGTDITNLVPGITVSVNAEVSPASGIAQDFTSPVPYTVTAENQTQKSYTVTVELDITPDVTNIWNGNISTDWNHPGNWSHGVPQEQMSVHIGAYMTRFPTISSNVTIKNLTVDAGATLMQVSGTLTIQGEFRLKSSSEVNASYIMTGGSIDIEPEKVIIEQVISNPGYNYAISSPVSGSLATRLNSGITGTTYIYNNPTNTYLQLDENEPFEPGTGMVFRNNDHIQFSGVINTGSVIVPLTRTSAGLGWNFIGNPYTAAVDWRSLNKTNVDDLFWIYRNDLGTYGTFNNNTGLAVGLNDPPYLIPSGHAIWVRVTLGQAEGAVTFSPNAMVHNPFSYLKAKKPHDYSFIKLISRYNGHSDEAAIAFVPESTKGASDPYDSDKLFGNNRKTAEIYTLSQGRPLAINALPQEESMTIPLGVFVRRSGVLGMQLSDHDLTDNTVVLLRDKLTGEITDLTSGQRYRTYLRITEEHYMEKVKEEDKPTRIDDRFELIITKSTPTGFKEELNSELQNPSNDDVHVYNSVNGIIVYAETKSSPFYLLYDSTGRRISTETLQPYEENNINLPQRGIYIISIIWEDNVKNRKIIF